MNKKDTYQLKIDALTEEIEVVVVLLKNRSVIGNTHIRKLYLDKIDAIAEEIKELKIRRVFQQEASGTHNAA